MHDYKKSFCGCLLLLGLLLFTNPSTAQTQPAPSATTPPQSAQTQPEHAESIIDQIKKCVVFLQGYYQRDEAVNNNGKTSSQPVSMQLSGTGFLIFVPDPRLGKDEKGNDIGSYYLVTNRHMIREPGIENGKLGEGPYFKNIVIRFNLNNASSDGSRLANIVSPVVDGTGSLYWFTDTKDDQVDLAIIPISLNPDTVDFKALAPSQFATKDVISREHIDENDEVLFAGLFAGSPGSKQNYPIVRHGRIARLDSERIPLDGRHPEITVDAHLADVMSWGGNSGSPVLVRMTPLRESAPLSYGTRYFLLGVMQGYFSQGTEFAIDVGQIKGEAQQNTGIAFIIPADKINEVLDTPRARANREMILANRKLQQGDREDAEQYYRSALNILTQTAPSHSDTANTMNLLANLLETNGKSGEAMLYRKQAQRILNAKHQDRMHPLGIDDNEPSPLKN